MSPLSSGRPGSPRPPLGPGPRREPVPGSGDRAALWILLGVHAILLATLLVAAWTLLKYLPTMPLSAWQKAMFQIGIGAALVAFGLRAALLWARLRRTPRA